MPHGLYEFSQHLRTSLPTDPELQEWALLHCRKAWTVLDGMPEAPTLEQELPGAVLESGVGTIEAKTLGGSDLEITTALFVTLSWLEPDEEKLQEQRLTLIDRFVRFVMRNKTMGGSVAQATAAGWEWIESRPGSPLATLAVPVLATYRVRLA